MMAICLMIVGIYSYVVSPKNPAKGVGKARGWENQKSEVRKLRQTTHRATSDLRIAAMSDGTWF